MTCSSGSADPRAAGNGSLMRLAPVAMYYAHRPDELGDRAADSSRTTHAAAEALDACRLFAAQVRAALLGATREQVLRTSCDGMVSPAVHVLAARDHFAVRLWHESHITCQVLQHRQRYRIREVADMFGQDHGSLHAFGLR
ncbi:ADP-ribosylglycohydrolase family protein [Xanthomonas euvesicatoria pv. eucalypti]|nr:ADP-ribosylglycohydrolase family protein [Xanthomonas euvesicatoria]KLC81935.1 hypothetical protein GEV915_06810 [Xanthomonas perforans]MDO7944915.1 ADP-ribosylglycohydrolase family protein [Xanthomonas euvesicatoria pv. eucalypti]WOP47040.1 ADP-ribosylglycohydrolase family protein [Xanthomonas euvesicatoria]WOP55551.1 ADP-ribosylglycohydrolase family protein [Xanthomonas euvesicatoria]